MLSRLKLAWRRNRMMTAAFVFAVFLALMFAVRSVVFVVYWSDPDHRDQRLETWMTPRYIARSWHLPDDIILSALGLEGMPGRRLTIEEIARAKGVPVQELEARIVAAAQQYRSRTQ